MQPFRSNQFQLNPFSGFGAVVVTRFFDFDDLLTYLLTDIKILSDAQLNTSGKIPCKFQFNTSSRLGGVVVTRFFDFDDLQAYLRTEGKNFCQVHN